jgi:hypothetical protein
VTASRQVRSELKTAAAHAELVRIVRSIRGADKLEGSILETGSEWLLMHELNTELFLDGHVAVRVADVRSVKPLGSSSFPARALRHYGEKPRRPGLVKLTSARTVIESASRRFPLVTIHVERRDPAVCYIGVPLRITSRSLRLREITPEAQWEDKPRTYRLGDITQVEIGGRYQRALLAVGGRPPNGNPTASP